MRQKCRGLWSQLTPLNSAIPLGQIILSAPVIQPNTQLISAPEGLCFYNISVESAAAFVLVSFLSWKQMASAFPQTFPRRLILFSRSFSSRKVAGKVPKPMLIAVKDMVKLLFVLVALNWQALFLNCSLEIYWSHSPGALKHFRRLNEAWR